MSRRPDARDIGSRAGGPGGNNVLRRPEVFQVSGLRQECGAGVRLDGHASGAVLGSVRARSPGRATL